MAVGLTVVLRMAPLGSGTRRTWGMISQYAEGAGAVFSVIYIFTLVSPISTNLFGYHGRGGPDARAVLRCAARAARRVGRRRPLRAELRRQVCYTRRVRNSFGRTLRAAGSAPGALA